MLLLILFMPLTNSSDRNTCYLNSSIQCLSHTPIFRDYFTSKVYLNDINSTNPLGHHGKLAQVTAVLINSMWKRLSQAAQSALSKANHCSWLLRPSERTCAHAEDVQGIAWKVQ